MSTTGTLTPSTATRITREGYTLTAYDGSGGLIARATFAPPHRPEDGPEILRQRAEWLGRFRGVPVVAAVVRLYPRGHAAGTLDSIAAEAAYPEWEWADDDERALFAAYRDGAVHVTPANHLAVHRALTDLANSEDHIAETTDAPDLARYARAARDGLSTLASRALLG